LLALTVFHLPSFFPVSRPPPALPSFPTRRSSDLSTGKGGAVEFVSIVQRSVNHARSVLSCVSQGSTSSKLRATTIGAHARSLRVDRKSSRLNSSHVSISYAVFCLKKKKEQERTKR